MNTTSRRTLLLRGIRIGTGAVAALSPLGKAFGQQTAPHVDEMTINSAPQQKVFPSPDFGPTPKQLPAEVVAVSGNGSLRSHAARHGLIYGAAVVVKLLDSDPVLAKLLMEQCGILVPEGELKWRALRPVPGHFDFTQADALFAFAKKHHILVRGHTLAWHNSVPDWLANSPASLDVRPLFIEHIRTVMGRYRGRVQSWDVVNEAILPKDGAPGGLRKSFWYERVGLDYIDLAYRTARETDPHAKLTYNDYGVEYDNAEDAERRKYILDLVRGMKSRGVPLDAIGIQSHIKAASPSTIGAGLKEYIEAIRQMGLEVYLTELDVNEDDIASPDVAERDRIIAQTYKDYLITALANPAVKLTLTWGISDRRTWLNDGPTHHRKQPNRPQRSLPFDPAYRPTSAFFAIRDSFDQRRQ